MSPSRHRKSPARLIDRTLDQTTELDRSRRLLAGLSDRETEIAAAIARGRTNAEIGAELYLIVATVKAYVTGVLAKLEATNRTQVALLVQQAERWREDPLRPFCDGCDGSKPPDPRGRS